MSGDLIERSSLRNTLPLDMTSSREGHKGGFDEVRLNKAGYVARSEFQNMVELVLRISRVLQLEQ